MKFMENLREWQIARIEQRVSRLTVLLSGLEAAVHPEVYAEVERERRDLWLRRSRLIKKQPDYEGVPHR